MKSHYERHGGTYHREDDRLIPDLTLPQEANEPTVGVWGRRHERWLKQERRALYNSLLLSGKLRDRLAETDERAERMLAQLVVEMAKREGVTEALKARDQMAWVRRMNAIRASAEETVCAEVIYAI